MTLAWTLTSTFYRPGLSSRRTPNNTPSLTVRMTADEAIDGIVRPAVTLVRALVEGEEAVVLDLAPDRVGEDSVVAGLAVVGDRVVPDRVGREVLVRVDRVERVLDCNGIGMGVVEEVLGAMNRRVIRCRRLK